MLSIYIDHHYKIFNQNIYTSHIHWSLLLQRVTKDISVSIIIVPTGPNYLLTVLSPKLRLKGTLIMSIDHYCSKSDQNDTSTNTEIFLST